MIDVKTGKILVATIYTRTTDMSTSRLDIIADRICKAIHEKLSNKIVQLQTAK